MRSFLRDIVTDYDSKTYDTGRCVAVFLILAMTCLQAVSTYKSGVFDAMAFGGGAAAVLGALGLAIAGDNHKRP
jgi:hypothetical protein